MNLVAKQSYLQKVLKSISVQHKGFRHFAERYLQHLSWAELERLKHSEVKSVLDDGWTFIQTWSKTSPKISIRNLSMLKKGEERGTIIQLLLKNVPFVADSIITEIRRQGYDVNFVLRGMFNVVRQKDILHEVLADSTDANEMLLHIELRQQVSLESLETLETSLLGIVRDIELSVADFLPMKDKLQDAKAALLIEGLHEEAAFLEWLMNDHFIFLGVINIKGNQPSNPLGIFQSDTSYADLLAELVATSGQPSQKLWFHKPSCLTPIDRYEPLDIIRVTTKAAEELVFVGILTYAARSVTFNQLPYVSTKLDGLKEQFATFNEIFEIQDVLLTVNHLPFTEVFNLPVEELAHICKGILSHQSKYMVLVHHRFDPILRQLSIMVFLHQEKLTDANREAIKHIISQTIGADIIHFEVDYIDNDLVCLYATLASATVVTDKLQELPKQLEAATLSWKEHTRAALIDICGVVEGEQLSKRYLSNPSSAYKSAHHPETAAKDILKIQESIDQRLTINIDFMESDQTDDTATFNLKFYKRPSPFSLYELFNLLNSFNLKLMAEASYAFDVEEQTFWIHDLKVSAPSTINLPKVAEPFKQLCQKLLSDEIANDELNSLALTEALNYRQITVLKAFLSYLKQIQFPFGGKYNRDILLRNSSLAALIVQLFEAKFYPHVHGDKRLELVASLTSTFEHELQALKTEDEDKLFRQLYNLVTHVLRTNYFVVDEQGQLKPYISFKIESKGIIDIPLPAPMVEIFVYAKEFESVHLRSGKVSRGGIRWSDRGEDYRTEVLGLVKAQNTKNAVIVPMGSKGGFYVKKSGATQTDAIDCYKNMMRAMLDITDNIVDGGIVNPDLVVRYDGDDPYLVVAADKGTASFSDIANGISAEYNFWLKDAFASGGSAGYDHKKMAITSRGAWESVKQHFKETLNKDPEVDTITAVGIGDMSGDVFGNGLLRSKTILLKAAFNHKHIFIDPNPDAAVSYAERLRMFNLPYSNWSDYDQTKLSTGGMIIERASKTVTLTPEAKALLGLAQDTVRPSDIMQAILKASVDLMWLGGIGTYIKATTETDEDVCDRANDAIRINGKDVGAAIIGEGANLGCTQRGRIEFAMTRKGRVNTDFIDNSGGVDCSDHEVNIKILLNQPVTQHELSLEARNILLKDMTDDIGRAVVQDNICQNLALSFAEYYSPELLDEYVALTQYLTLNAGLNPNIEFLPSIPEFNERQKLQQGLTRPELAILMAYTKNHLKSELLKSSVLDHAALKGYLKRYFPSKLETYAGYMDHHPLKREIIVTNVVNEIVDRLGIPFIHRLIHQTGKSTADILNAYIMVKDFFELEDHWAAFDAVLPQLTYEDRIDFMDSVSRAVYNGCAWLLMFGGNTFALNTSDTLTALLPLIKGSTLLLSVPTECVMPSNTSVALKQHIHDIHQRLTTLQLSVYGNDYSAGNMQLFETTFHQIKTKLSFDMLGQILANIPDSNFWSRLFVLSTQLELDRLHGHLTKQICISILAQKKSVDGILEQFDASIGWISRMIQQTMTNAVYDPAAVTVIMRHLESLSNAIIRDIE